MLGLGLIIDTKGIQKYMFVKDSVLVSTRFSEHLRLCCRLLSKKNNDCNACFPLLKLWICHSFTHICAFKDKKNNHLYSRIAHFSHRTLLIKNNHVD